MRIEKIIEKVIFTTKIMKICKIFFLPSQFFIGNQLSQQKLKYK
jgi:hypothetical protein